MPRTLRRLPKLLWVWPLACAAWAGQRRQSPEPLDTVALLQTTKSQHTEDLREADQELAQDLREADPELAQAPEGQQGSHPEGEARTGRVLVFWAVGSDPRAIQLVRQNVELMREEVRNATWPPLSVDVFLAHYDHRQDLWKASHEAAQWYEENVQYSVEETGYKMKLAKRWLLELGRPDIHKYEWLWLLDEDADFSGGTKLRTLLSEARHSGAGIVGPAVVAAPTSGVSMERHAGDWGLGCQPGNPMCKLAAPDPRCRYRYTNFVEVMFTFIRPTAFEKALTGCPDCLHDNSVWGLDKTWCVMVAHSLKRSYKKFCAIMDRVQVIHENLKTLDKWKGPRNLLTETGNIDVINMYHEDMDLVRQRHPAEFQPTQQVLQCVEK